MKLDGKKELASRTLKVGKGRIVFNSQRLEEIKDLLTKQDVRDLTKSGAIIVKEIKGRKTKTRRKTRRKDGSIKKRVNKRKRNYIILTRKLRAYISAMKEKGLLDKEKYWMLRKEIRASSFRSKAHMKERINNLIKERE